MKRIILTILITAFCWLPAQSAQMDTYPNLGLPATTSDFLHGWDDSSVLGPANIFFTGIATNALTGAGGWLDTTTFTTKVGTPVGNQVGVFAGDGPLGGDPNFTFDGVSLNLGVPITLGTNKITGLGDPTEPQDAATKEYVDVATSAIDIDYFLNDTASDVGGIYYDMTSSALGGVESTLSVPGLTSATNDQALVNFLTDETGGVGILTIVAGTFEAHFHAEKTAGTSDTSIYGVVYKRAAGGAETLIATTEISDLITSKTGVSLHAHSDVDTTMLATDRIVLKLFANVGGGSGSTVAVYLEGTTVARLAFPATSEVLNQIFVRQDGIKPMTADWVFGAFDLTGGVDTTWSGTGTFGAVDVLPSATPGWLFQNSTAGADTAFIYANSSGGAYDMILYFGVEDSTGESTDYIEVDGVSETVDFLKPTTLQTGDVAGGEIAAITASEWIPIGWAEDGTTAPAAIAAITGTTRNKGRGFSATVNNDVTFIWQVPKDFTGTTVTAQVTGIVSAATAPANTEIIHFTVALGCWANSELSTIAEGTLQATALTADATYVQYDTITTVASSAITPAGSIAAGETCAVEVIRLAATTDTYAQLFSVTGVIINYSKQLAN